MAKLPACPNCRYRFKQSDIGSDACPKCHTDIGGLLLETQSRAPELGAREAASQAKVPDAALGDSASYIDKLAEFLALPASMRRRKTLIFIAWGTLSLLVAASIFTNTDQNTLPSAENLVRGEIDSYARSLASSASAGVLDYKSTEQTHTEPQSAYKVVYRTNNPSLKVDPVLSKDSPGAKESTTVALIWKMKFCSKALVGIMARRDVALVEGDLVDAKSGELHQVAMCNPHMYSAVLPPGRGAASKAAAQSTTPEHTPH